MLPCHTSPQAGPALHPGFLEELAPDPSLCLQSLVEWTELPPRAAVVPYPKPTPSPTPPELPGPLLPTSPISFLFTPLLRLISLYGAAGNHS